MLEDRRLLATFFVTIPGDDPSGATPNQLRWAIDQVNAGAGDTIDFVLGSPGTPQTITLSAPLPAILKPVAINGWSQNGGNPGVMIGINGGRLTGDGLVFNTGASSIDGLAVYNFNGNGVDLNNPTGSAGDSISNCNIGTNTTGAAPGVGNTGNGVVITGGQNTIGGVAPYGDVISGNAGSGVLLNGAGASGNILLGNLIGTDLSGSMPLPNLMDGITLNAAPGNTVGGTATGAGNVVSGNLGNGITLTSGADGNLISVNLIGTNEAGTCALGNGNDGVLVASNNNTIGAWDGTPGGDGAATVISGNGNAGIDLAGNNDDVVNCYVGADITGMVGIGNGGDGADVEGTGDVIGVTVAPIGLLAPPASEFVGGATGFNITGSGGTFTNCFVGVLKDGATPKGNKGDGVLISGAAAKNNTVSGNVISANTGNGVDIANGAANNSVTKNVIGLDKSGWKTPTGNGKAGVLINGATGNTIGAAGAGNTISSNAGAGVQLQASANKNVIQGNWIGTDNEGILKKGNVGSGVFLDSSDDNTIGGSFGWGDGNIISANGGDGVTNQFSSRTVVQGNYVGTDIHGKNPLANTGDGIKLVHGSSVTIGGVGADVGNLISGNGGIGVDFDAFSRFNAVESNVIGADQDATYPVPNGQSGIFLSGQSNTIGGVWTVTGNIISGNTDDGITISALGNHNWVQGNSIGTDLAGTSLILGNGHAGIYDDGLSNTIGGTAAAQGNVISGNANQGILLQIDSSSNLVESNFIGTDASGTIATPNATGIVMYGSQNVIGAPMAVDGTTHRITGLIAGNIISGNTGDGVYIGGMDCQVLGNYIGIKANGTTSLGNGWSGIDIAGGTGNTIGGVAASAGNVISGNGIAPTATYKNGVTLNNSAIGNALYNNYIGTDITGTQPLGNAGDGVYIDPTAYIGYDATDPAWNQGGANWNSIGGVAGQGNLISANGGYGINLPIGKKALPDYTVEDYNIIGLTVTGANVAALNNKNGDAPAAWVPGSHDQTQ